ncbi:MAG: peptidylprolyl isomerase [Hoeflea sp.]|uniref:FKBP-type peptidyl-prolyl cis-trans isomerase n=1 Tax=Hoeflea sp. TaxID=1940281 RepID=UPI000C0D6ACC|nr:peptidylprolyl isomerase [Hoeflea sp.]PHR23366.1 MAG: peptidylprolyl isomerase [Hoeflea sp.]|tara:strand:- start:14552 stop:14989 length:438 start_codon:yes stop_codon:yes gene_type:complete
MSEAKSGDTVRINYTGKLTDGTQFDSSEGREPLEFQVGSGQIISGLDREVEGMKVGDKQTVTVPAEEAYGAHDPAKVQQVPRSALPPELEPQEGMQLQAQTPQGGQVALMITSVGEQEITVDANHPLAGKDLVFDIEMVEILQAA